MMAGSWVILDKNGRHKFIKFIATALVDNEFCNLLLTIKPHQSELHISNHIGCLSGVHAGYVWPIIDSTMTADMSIEVPAKSFYALIDKLISFDGHIQLIQIKPDTFQLKSVYESSTDQGDLFGELSSADFIPVNDVKYSLTVPSSSYDSHNQYYFDQESPIHSLTITSSVLLEYLKHIKAINNVSFSNVNNDEFTSFVVGLGSNGNDESKIMKILSGKGQSLVSYGVAIDSSIGQAGRCHLNADHLSYLIGILTQVKNTVTLELHVDRLIVRNLGWFCCFKVILANFDRESRERQLRLFDRFVEVDAPKYLLESLIRLDITESNEKNKLKLQYSHQEPTQIHIAIHKGTTQASDVLTIPTPWFEDDVSISINVQALNEILRFLSDGAWIGFDKKTDVMHLRSCDGKYYFALQCMSTE